MSTVEALPSPSRPQASFISPMSATISRRTDWISAPASVPASPPVASPPQHPVLCSASPDDPAIASETVPKVSIDAFRAQFSNLSLRTLSHRIPASASTTASTAASTSTRAITCRRASADCKRSDSFSSISPASRRASASARFPTYVPPIMTDCFPSNSSPRVKALPSPSSRASLIPRAISSAACPAA